MAYRKTRTQDSGGPWRTRNPEGPRTVGDLFCLEREYITKQNDDKDQIVELLKTKVLLYIFINKKYV